MEDLLILLGFACTASVLVVPVASLLMAMSARKQLIELERRFGEVEAKLWKLEAERRDRPLRAPARPLEAPVEAPPPATVAPPAEPVAQLAPEAPPPEAPPPVAPPPVAPPPVAPRPEPRAPAPPPAVLPPPPPRPAAPPLRFEAVAIRALAGLGGLGVVVAGFFFYDLAVEMGIITPAVRYALGLLLGLGMIIGAEPLWRRDYRLPAAALAGAGLGVLYAALYAGVTRYDLLGVPPTFALMAVVTVVATLLAVRHNSLFLAMLGAIGGYGTPIMLSTGQNRAVALFTYVALLNAGLLVAAHRRRWPALVGFAGLSTLVLQLGWAFSFRTVDQAPIGLIVPILMGALFATLALLSREDEAVGFAAAVSALGALLAPVPFLVPAPPPVEGLTGLSPLGASVAGALTLLVAVAGNHALAARRALPALSVATALVAALPLLAFTLGWNLEEPPVPWPVCAALLAVPVLSWGLAGPGHAPALSLVVSAFGAIVGTAALLDSLPEGGSLAPPLVSAAGLTLISLAITRRFSWGPLVGLALSTATVALLAETWSRREQPELTVAAGAAFFVVLLAFPFVAARSEEERRRAGPWLAAALAGPALFLPMYWAWKEAWGEDVIGVLPVVFGVASLAGVAALVRSREAASSDRDLALFTAVALLFLSAAIPIQLRDEWLTIGWALEVAALAWVRGRLTHPMLTPFALALALGVSVRLLLNPATLDYHPVEGPVVLNWITYTWGVPALALIYAAGRLPDAPGWTAPAMRISAILMLFALVNLQVSHAFASEGDLRFLSEDFAEEMTRSLSWGAFGLLLLVAGVVARSRMVRIVAFLFLLLAAGKAFLVDLGNLGGLARVGSLLGSGVFLIVAAVLFRWLDKRLEADDPGEETR